MRYSARWWIMTDVAEAILDAAPVVIFVLDSQRLVMCWNHAAAALTGISSGQIRGQPFPESLLFPEDIAIWKREFERVYAGSPPRQFACRWEIRDNPLLPLVFSCSVLRDSAGNIEYSVCTLVEDLAARERSALSREFMADRTAELKNISRFLHDTIVQDLVALSFKLNNLESLTLDSPARIEAESARELFDHCSRDTRMISYMLAPPALLQGTLKASIEQYTEEVREETGIRIATDIDHLPENFSSEAQLLLFTAVQEWAVRAIRSNPKARFSVHLKTPGARADLEMVCAPPTTSSRAGWTLIREHTRSLGGSFDIATDSTRLVAKLSLPDSGK
jgi:PAS domain S-box-containing protein